MDILLQVPAKKLKQAVQSVFLAINLELQQNGKFTSVNYFIELEKAEMEKKNLKILKKEVKHSIENPYKLGDVLVNSWGYDQTNVNFYQVVEVKAKSVVIIEICYKVVENSAGYDSCRIVPVKDNFVNNKPISKRIQVYINSEGEPVYYFSSEYGSLLKHQEGETHYKSWYA